VRADGTVTLDILREPPIAASLDEVVKRISAICDEFECYGYRRVRATLRHQGVVVNSKKIRRLMREHDLQPKRRRRYVVTTDSNHDRPVFKNLAKGLVVERPNQLWIAGRNRGGKPIGLCLPSTV
jgi:putative transposase